MALHRPLVLTEKKTRFPKAWGVSELLSLPHVHLRVALLEPCLRHVPKASVSVFAPWPLLNPGFLGPALPLPTFSVRPTYHLTFLGP